MEIVVLVLMVLVWSLWVDLHEVEVENRVGYWSSRFYLAQDEREENEAFWSCVAHRRIP